VTSRVGSECEEMLSETSVEIMPEKRSGGSVSFNSFKYLDSARIAYQKGAIEGKPTISLLNLLISPRRVEFTDPRDIIFGYMGVAKSPIIGEFSDGMAPDRDILQ
jgi:hypothetical protein